MKRFAFASSVIVLLAFGVVSVFAQAKPAQAPASKAAAPAATTPAATQQAPAAPAKFIKPLKGTADIQFMETSAKRVGNDIVTVLKIKNMSTAPIALLKVDEYWYNKAREVVTGDSQPYRKPFMPGEVIELTLKAPYKTGMDISVSQYMFSHSGGQVNPKRVKKFD
jgi:hypothetical protein